MSAQQQFIDTYNHRTDVRRSIDKALMSIGAGLEEYDEPATWAECIECLADLLNEKLTVETVQGIATPDHTLYPLATYGWDGGSAINSQHLNLTELASSDVEGGPCASLMARTDPSYPGIALHYAEREKRLTIQLF